MALETLIAVIAAPFVIFPLTLLIDVLTLAYHRIMRYLQNPAWKRKRVSAHSRGELANSGSSSLKSPPEVTVIISAHKEAGLIEMSLRSIIRQDYPVKNIYISDSNLDNTKEEVLKLKKIVAGFKKEFPEIYYWSKEGVTSKSEKLNNLVRDSKVNLGEYIYFVDSGLRIHPGTVKKLVEKAESEGAGAATSFGYVSPPLSRKAGYFHYGKEWINRISKFRKTAQSYRRGVFVVCGASFLVRSEVAKEIPIPTKVRTEDTAYTWKLQEEGYRISFAPDAIVSTADVPTLKRQLKQSYRWYSGTWQVIYTQRHVFGPRSKAKSLAYLSVLPGLLESTMYSVAVLLFPLLLYVSPVYAAYFVISDTIFTFLAPIIGLCLSGEPRKIPRELWHTLRHYHHIFAFKFMSSALWVISFLKVAIDIATGKNKNWGNKWNA